MPTRPIIISESTTQPINSSLTFEQFFYHQMRIVAGLYIQGLPLQEIVEQVKRDNLFQYPTERKLSSHTYACLRRIFALHNDELVHHLATATSEVAKQINLYAMMCYNNLTREFMTVLIGEKYRHRDYSYTKRDQNIFFSQLTEQHPHIASWSEQTVSRLKQVLTRCLIETQLLTSLKHTTLNPILISSELHRGITAKGDFSALPAFNCFDSGVSV